MLQWLIGKDLDGSRQGMVDAGHSPDPYRHVAIRPLLSQVERMAKMGFWRYEIRSRAVFWSPQVFAIHGLPTADHVDVEKALGHFPQPHRAVLEQAMGRAITQGEAYDLELDFTSADGVHKRVRAMAEPERSNGRITALIGIFQDISDRHRLEEELRAAATTDPLTGMANRRHLEMFYRDSRLDRDRKSRTGFALAIIDLDHFKQINDLHGHAAGDHALKMAGERLQSRWLARCFAARLGGDEFVLLITQSELMDDLGEVCERLLADLAEPMKWHGHEIDLSATVGVAVSEWGSVSVQDMLDCADAALYVAKNKGRGSAAITSREDLFMGDPEAMETVYPIKAA